jgi:hypothetical protein
MFVHIRSAKRFAYVAAAVSSLSGAFLVSAPAAASNTFASAIFASPRQPWSGAGSNSSGGFPMTYGSKSACVNHYKFMNTVLPENVGEFASHGLNMSYWGAQHSRSEPPAATWAGFQTSWGAFQYNTYFGNANDGSGNTPFTVMRDTAVAGSPNALRILSEPMPKAMQNNPAYGDGWTASNLTSSVLSPSAGGSITIPVAQANMTHQGWLSGIGRPKNVGGGGEDDPQGVVFVGTVTAGGCTVNQYSGQCTGGSTQITLSKVEYFEGHSGTTIPNGADFQAWDFPGYYSGVLDTNVNQQYGLFVARMRLPQPLPGLSPAWWMLETGGVGQYNGQLMRSEWDVEEQFAADYGYDLNAGNILWNTGYAYGCGLNCPAQNNTTGPGATGVYPWPSTSTTNYSSGYHDYAVLISPGGPAFPTGYWNPGVYVENNSPYVGTTYFVDGYPIAGHIGEPDLTQGSPDKEIMLMFQIGGGWLDPGNQIGSDPWPQNMWVQWLRAYQPTATSC